MIQHIIYFSTNHIFIFQWQRKVLITSTKILADDEGFSNFEYYLQAHKNTAFKVIVDIYEEDYRREKIPNVRGKDRKSVIDRLIDRYYRDEKYVYIHKLSRSKIGRKDAQVLLCALGENDVVEKSLSLMKKNQIIISGIWSLAVISNQITKHLSIKSGCTLLVSQQTDNHQREMFFKESDLYFSRKTSIDSNIGKSFFEKVQQTNKFITNQKIMGVNEPLNIISIYDDVNEKAISNADETTALNSHVSYTINEIVKKLRLKNCNDAIGAVLFSYLCTTMPNRSNHYLKEKDRTHYRHYLYNKVATHFTATAFLLLAAASLVLFIQQRAIEKDSFLLQEQYTSLQKEYADNYSDYSDQLSYSNPIKNVLDTAYKLKISANITPFNYFLPISSTFNNRQFSLIRIDNFHWEKLTKEGKARAELQFKGNISDLDPYSSIENMESDDSNKPLNIITLEGTITEPFDHYRDNIALVNQWKNSLQALDEVNRAVIIETPADIRPSKQFTDNITEKENIGSSTIDNEKKYRFKIIIDLKAHSNDNNSPKNSHSSSSAIKSGGHHG